MDRFMHPPEFRAPPPEAELRPELELTPPPPEFGQGSGPAGEPPARKRRLRQILALPAILLLGFLFVHGTGTLPTPPETEPVPVESAEPLPSRPEGSLVLDLLYAVRDADTVRYSYTVYVPIPSLDAAQAQGDEPAQLWPVSVYARVSDETGRVVSPAEDPEVWEGSRAAFAYSLDAAGMEGRLTLTLTAVYLEQGEERQTQVERRLPELPPTPELSAVLTRLDNGQIDYTAEFIPQAGDDHAYRLRPDAFTLQWLDENGEPCGFSQVWDPDTLPTLGRDAESGGFTALYQGPARLESPAEHAAGFYARLILTDEETGYPYAVDSNVLALPREPILSGWLEAYPGGDAEAEFRFAPAPGDARAYQLRVVQAGQQVYDGGETMGLSLLDDPGSLAVTDDGEAGFLVRYSGGTAAASIPAGSQLSLYVVLEDQSSGERWTVETNRVDPVERISAYETWPLAEGKLTITVYNDTPDIFFPSPVQTDSYLTILAVDTMPESAFTEYALPAALTPEGYEFGGWVIHVNNPFDLSSESDLFAQYNGDPPVEALLGEGSFAFPVGGTLTREDLERVPPSEDGVRYVNVHPVWIARNPERDLIFLEDGFGETSAYGMESPLASEGYLYLCAYPVPTREGMVFEGWYDENGNRVDMLVCYFSFVPALWNEDGSFAGYDWGSYEPVRLKAHWKPG